jgi:hypothetical protein
MDDIDFADKVVSLDDLVTLFSSDIMPPRSEWGRRLAGRLRKNVLPIFARQRSFTATEATAIRFTAVCLMSEYPRFQEIAAGITLLERRMTGEAQPNETIFLARD